MIHDLETIFGKFKAVEEGKRAGDKFKISDVHVSYGKFPDTSITKIERLINLLSDLTGWKYYPEKWTLKGLNVFNYSKGIEENLNNRKYFEIINQNPISLAITATKRIEYTLEKPDKF